jgi:hypothetical protein
MIRVLKYAGNSGASREYLTGMPTADDKALDGDVILAAQAATLGSTEDQVVLATDNVGHLSRYVGAERWQDIA